MLKSLFVGVAAVAFGGVAHAGAPIPGTQHNPPRFVDESTVWIAVYGGNDEGYLFRGEADVYGYADGDRVRLDWTQGGRVLATTKCDIAASDRDEHAHHVRCRYDAKPLHATGAIQANLVYEDDQDDKAYLVRTFRFDVKKWDKETWQIAADDVIADAYVWHGRDGQAENEPVFRFWIAGAPDFDATLRCTAAGQKLHDFDGTVQAQQDSDDAELDADVLPAHGDRQSWKWARVQFAPNHLKFGGHADDQYNTYLGAHAGDWTCDLRKSGVAVRTFLFHVNDQGRVDPSAMQQAKDAPPAAPNVSLIAVHIPSGNGVDMRIEPAALRRSHAFGMPWPKDPSVKAILGALPAKYENAHPVAVRPKGKLLDGVTHDPPRFVDESSTFVFLTSAGKGYRFDLKATVGGVTGAKSDRYRLEWRSGGRLLATVGCPWDLREYNPERAKIGEIANLDCNDLDVVLHARGPAEAKLIYSDDEDGNEYVMRTYKLDVAKFTSMGDEVWQVVADDALGGAWAEHAAGDPTDENGRRLQFWMWFARDLDGASDMELRCTVGGQRLKDIKVEAADVQKLVADPYGRDGAHHTYTWSRTRLETELYWGPAGDKTIPDEYRQNHGITGDHPGAWTCDLRYDGKVLRQLAFTIGSDGRVAPGDLASARGAVPTLPEIVPVELRIPRDEKFDERIRPNAIRKSRAFGLPWPQAASVKAMLGSLPPAHGLPDPR